MTDTGSENTTDMEELDAVSSEAICESLRTQIQGFAEVSDTVDSTFRSLLRKVKHAELWTAETLELTPKPPAAKWLTAHGWTRETILFTEFLELFFRTARTLNLENQSLHLEKEEADLFHVSEEVSIYELLQNLPHVFA